MAGTNNLLGKADRKTDLSQGMSVAKAETGLDLRVFVSHYLLLGNHFAGFPPSLVAFLTLQSDSELADRDWELRFPTFLYETVWVK